MTTRAQADLARIGASVRERFSSERRVLSFDEYLALFEESPYRFTRDAARYLADCFGHFGTAEVQRAGRKVQRFRLFDLPWDERRKNERLVGQEEIQAEFHRALSNFVREGRINRLVMLHGPNGNFPPRMPKSVTLPCNSAAKTIHFLSGVSGWGHPYGTDKSVTMTVRLRYANGDTEDHPLRNGEHFADYIRRVDVPGSKFAFALRGQQIRYLTVHPQKPDVIESIELVKGNDQTAPVVMAVTVETADKK